LAVMATVRISTKRNSNQVRRLSPCGDTLRGIRVEIVYSVSNTLCSGLVVPDDDNFNVRTEVNDLAIRYASCQTGPIRSGLSEAGGCFHGYLIKYTNMVIRGQLPNPTSRVGKDAAEMLKKLLPRGSNPDQAVLSKTCHTLHLAFRP